MPLASFDRNPSPFAIRTAAKFIGNNAFSVVLISALLVVPCFWHSRIQAGDLGSHVYNAWLAQLIEHHQISGLVLVRQWDNVLCDFLVLRTGNVFGFVTAEKIVVSFAVLVFFWGCFSFLAEVSGRPPWKLMPLLFVLAYGYVFHMGFMNYYLSLGIAFFALALVWRGGAGNCCLAGVLSALCFSAHPIGFLLFVTLAVYVRVWRVLTRWVRPILPVVAMISLLWMKFYFAAHPLLSASRRPGGVLDRVGQDRVDLICHRSALLSWLVLAWGAL